MIKKIAIFTHAKYGFEAIYENDADKSGDYARTSEVVEVNFPDRKIETVVATKVDILRLDRAELTATYLTDLQKLDEKIQELLSITHQPAAATDDDIPF